MNTIINAKELRASLPKVVARVQKGAQYTVLYRSRPAFKLVPIDDSAISPSALKDDPLYHATALGRSADGKSAADHDSILYGR